MSAVYYNSSLTICTAINDLAVNYFFKPFGQAVASRML